MTTIESKAFQAVAKELERERQRNRELEIEIMALRAEIAELKQELRDELQLNDALIEQIVPAECVADDLKERVIELESLFELQRKRTMEADKLWQQAHNQPDVWPDLGELIGWLMSEIDRLRKRKDK